VAPIEAGVLGDWTYPATSPCSEMLARIHETTAGKILPDGGERYLSTTLFQVVADVEPETRLQLLNTFTRRAEVFRPLGEQVTMYTCGPTVHALPHLGLYRRIVVADLVRRTVELAGYPVKHVMNVTDLDDRTLQAAEKAGMPLAALTGKVTDEFMEDIRVLGVAPAESYPRASVRRRDGRPHRPTGEGRRGLREAQVGLLQHQQVRALRQALGHRR